MIESFITGDIWSQANDLTIGHKNKTVAIAYITSENLHLDSGDILICDASDFAIKFGETSAATLYKYFRRGVKLYSNKQLHSKVLLTNGLLIVGSANLSRNSAKNLIESAIATNKGTSISQAKAFFHSLINESTLLTLTEIKRLLNIKVIPRPRKPIGTSKTRKMRLGDNCWFLPVYTLTDKTYEKIKTPVERTTRAISRKEGIDEDEIGFIRWHATSIFGKSVQEGEQLIVKWNNKNNSRSFIYPPSTVLAVERVGKYIYLFHDLNKGEEMKIPFSKFKLLAKSAGVEKQFINRVKTIHEDEIELLQSVWK